MCFTGHRFSHPQCLFPLVVNSCSSHSHLILIVTPGVCHFSLVCVLLYLVSGLYFPVFALCCISCLCFVSLCLPKFIIPVSTLLPRQPLCSVYVNKYVFYISPLSLRVLSVPWVLLHTKTWQNDPTILKWLNGSRFASILVAVDPKELCSFNQWFMDQLQSFQASNELQLQTEICQCVEELMSASWWTVLLLEYREIHCGVWQSWDGLLWISVTLFLLTSPVSSDEPNSSVCSDSQWLQHFLMGWHLQCFPMGKHLQHVQMGQPLQNVPIGHHPQHFLMS